MAFHLRTNKSIYRRFKVLWPAPYLELMRYRRQLIRKELGVGGTHCKPTQEAIWDGRLRQGSRAQMALLVFLHCQAEPLLHAQKPPTFTHLPGIWGLHCKTSFKLSSQQEVSSLGDGRGKEPTPTYYTVFYPLIRNLPLPLFFFLCGHRMLNLKGVCPAGLGSSHGHRRELLGDAHSANGNRGSLWLPLSWAQHASEVDTIIIPLQQRRELQLREVMGPVWDLNPRPGPLLWRCALRWMTMTTLLSVLCR